MKGSIPEKPEESAAIPGHSSASIARYFHEYCAPNRRNKTLLFVHLDVTVMARWPRCNSSGPGW